jgi:hypothetical protein
MNLDAILDATREPLPGDDGFSSSVVARVIQDASRKRPRMQLVTVAAAVILLAGAVAALVRSTGPSGERALETNHGGRATVHPAPASPAGTSGRPAIPPGRAAAHTPVTHREGSLEWGYKTDTSAYTFDHETGLRLEMEIYRTQLDTDAPHRVTLRIENKSKRPATVNAPHGCGLVVAAFPADRSHDPTPWRCATPDNPSLTRQTSNTFVLEPGQRRTAEATVVLPTSGDWAIVGMCQCTFGPVRTSDPVMDPLDLMSVAGALPIGSPDRVDRSAPHGLATPPIRVRAS